jgi:hypothetical protein
LISRQNLFNPAVRKGRGVLGVVEAASFVSRIFCATKSNARGFIEEKCGMERLVGRLPYGAGI